MRLTPMHALVRRHNYGTRWMALFVLVRAVQITVLAILLVAVIRSW